MGFLKGSMARSGATGFQLLEPVTEEVPQFEWLRTHGEGLHHICVLVDDVEAATKALEEEGGKVIFLTAGPGVEPMRRESYVEIAGPGSITLEIRELPA